MNIFKKKEEFIKYLESRRKYIEDNIIDLYDLYDEKQRIVLQEKESLKKGMEQQIEEMEELLKQKKEENSQLEDKVKHMSSLMRKIEEQSIRVENIKKRQDSQRAENQERLFGLMSKFNKRSNIELAKQSIEGRRVKYKEIAIKFLEEKVKEAVERNKDLGARFAKLKRINERCDEEKLKIDFHKIELEREKLLKEKVNKRLKVLNKK